MIFTDGLFWIKQFCKLCKSVFALLRQNALFIKSFAQLASKPLSNIKLNSLRLGIVSCALQRRVVAAAAARGGAQVAAHQLPPAPANKDTRYLLPRLLFMQPLNIVGSLQQKQIQWGSEWAQAISGL